MRDELTVTVTNPASGGSDDYGDGPTGSPPAPVDLPGCLFAPATSTERTDVRTPAVITGGTVYVGPLQLAAARAAIRPASVLTIPGFGVFAVEGDLGVWGSAGAEVAVKRWTGRVE